MIKYETGDIFKSNADCLVNTVNCEGYMGKGLAYQFKMKFPQNNEDYIKACKSGKLFIGTVHFFKEGGKTIINFPTKNKWKAPSKMEYVEKGLDAMLEVLPSLGVRTVAIPPLGCGNGGLEWGKVKRLLENKLQNYQNQFEFIIYGPSKGYVQIPPAVIKLNVSSLIIMQIKMKLKEFTRLRLQATAYFMNVFSGQSYFEFKKCEYGPYSDSIDSISEDIGEYQRFYGIEDTTTTFDMVYWAICSEKTDKVYNRFLPALNRAAEYVNSINDNMELECIFTVLYLINEEDDNSSERLVMEFKGWSEYKAKRFSEKMILDAIDYLEKTGIIMKDPFSNCNVS